MRLTGQRNRYMMGVSSKTVDQYHILYLYLRFKSQTSHKTPKLKVGISGVSFIACPSIVEACPQARLCPPLFDLPTGW